MNMKPLLKRKAPDEFTSRVQKMLLEIPVSHHIDHWKVEFKFDGREGFNNALDFLIEHMAEWMRQREGCFELRPVVKERDGVFDDYHGLDKDGSPCKCEHCVKKG